MKQQEMIFEMKHPEIFSWNKTEWTHGFDELKQLDHCRVEQIVPSPADGKCLSDEFEQIRTDYVSVIEFVFKTYCVPQ